MRKGQALSYGQQGSRQDFARGGADARPGRPMPLKPGLGTEARPERPMPLRLGLGASRGPHMPTNI